MLRMIYVFIYMSSYLLYSIPTLYKLRKLDPDMTVENQDKLLHALPKHWAKGIMKRTGANVTVSGKENIPNGPVLFVANHEGNFDIPVLLGFIEKPFGFISKVEVKKVPIIRDWMVMISCVFIDRTNRRQSVQMIRQAAENLKKGHSLVIFPEGTRSRGAGLKEFKTGAMRIAKEAGVPIVPIAVSGTSGLFEVNKFGVTPSSVQIQILPPVTAQEISQYETKELSQVVKTRIQEELEKSKRAS